MPAIREASQYYIVLSCASTDMESANNFVANPEAPMPVLLPSNQESTL
jgi:hypothetical protein